VQPEPSVGEWVAAVVAAVAIVGVGGQLLLGRVGPDVSRWSRLAGSMIASLAAASLLAAAVLGGAGLQASRLDPAASGDDRPTSGFARVLLDLDPEVTERVASFGLLLLVPLAAVLVVLAAAAVDPARTIGLRVVQAVVCSAVAVIAAAIAFGDTGVLATRASVAVCLLAVAALAALAIDEVTHPRDDDYDDDGYDEYGNELVVAERADDALELRPPG
jgi:hypothetical protein